MDSMKTTIDIPENELEEAIRHSGAKTKREAVVTAVADFNRRRRLEKLARDLGSFENMIRIEELLALRTAD
jgi:Arc/MetJ family transcription regulator